MNKTALINEIVLEDHWRISCKLMKELERELDIEGKFPVDVLLISDDLMDKWNEYVELN